LVKSENWQALNLLAEKYREKVQTIYIDPPFNKEQEADYLYSVKYKDATWITMLENRLSLAKEFLKDTGSIFVRCDYNGNMYIRFLMDAIYGEENFRNEIILQRGLQTRKAEKRFLNKTDSLFFYFKTVDKGVLAIPYTEKEHVKAYQTTLSVLRGMLDKHEIKKIEQIIYETLWMPFLSMPGEQKTIQYREIFGVKLYPPKGRHWAFSQENLDIAVRNGTARLKCNNCQYVISHENNKHFRGKCPRCGRSDFVGEIFSLYNQVNNNWTDIPGFVQDPEFPTRNSEILLKRILASTSNESDLVMDFFLGSGTTTAAAHKLKRRWIGVEMGEHFWTKVMPRMKKVLFYDSSEISRDDDVKERYNQENSGGFFKYHLLEQYEDTLHNIDLNIDNGRKALEAFRDTEEEHEYLMRYFLRYETEGSPSLLNIEYFRNPFEYKFKIISNGKGEEVVTVDLVETFNYLIGLHVSKYKFVNDNGRRYVFVLGRRGGRRIAVVWRSTDNIDLEKDKGVIENVIKDYSPDEIYINGDALIDSYRVIESEFKALMGV
jgi:adenine-specific DNA-methyltransferase